jgi:hypothetical protein
MLDSIKKAQRLIHYTRAWARRRPATAGCVPPACMGRWIDAHKDRTVGMRVMAGPDIIGRITRYDRETIVLAVSDTPTPLLVSRDKVVMMYVMHEDAAGAPEDDGSPA